MSIEGGDSGFPRSIRHKQVLDIARDRPDASIEEIAAEVSSATPEMVERILDEYGDPAADESDSETGGTVSETDGTISETDGTVSETDGTISETDGTISETDGTISETDSAMTAENATKSDEVDVTAGDRNEDGEPSADPEHDSYPSPEDLSEKQREVLAAVAARPDATQAEIGEQLGVTSATVSNRANSIEGFSWYDRESFVDAVFEEPPSIDAPVSTDRSPDGSSPDGDADGSSPDGDADGSSPDGDADGSSPDDKSDEFSSGVDSSSGGSAEDDVLEDHVSDLRESIDELRTHIADLEVASDRRESRDPSPFEDPELVHKIVHACLDSEAITEAEELRILEAILE